MWPAGKSTMDKEMWHLLPQVVVFWPQSIRPVSKDANCKLPTHQMMPAIDGFHMTWAESAREALKNLSGLRVFGCVKVSSEIAQDRRV